MTSPNIILLRRFLAENPHHIPNVMQADMGRGAETVIELSAMSDFADWCVKQGLADPRIVGEFKKAVEEQFPGTLKRFLKPDGGKG